MVNGWFMPCNGMECGVASTAVVVIYGIGVMAATTMITVAEAAAAAAVVAGVSTETKDMKMIDPLTRLPGELFVPICTFLSDRELSLDISRVSTTWNKASSHDIIWKNKFIEEFVYETDATIAKQKAEEKVLQECITRGVCTIAVTKRDYLMQQIYICNTCVPPSQRLSSLIGCCATCARICHADHKIVKGPRDLFYCDCMDILQSSSPSSRCCALPAGFIIPPVGSLSVATIDGATNAITPMSSSSSSTIGVSKHINGSVQYCTICTQISVRPVTTNACDHIMCYTCIASWATTRQSCPLCKRQFTALLDHSSSSTTTTTTTAAAIQPMVIPLSASMTEHGRHARVAWRAVFKEQWISERTNAQGWTAYFQGACRLYGSIQKLGWIGLDGRLWYRSRRFRLTSLETKDIVSRIRDDNHGGTITIAGVTYYVMKKYRGDAQPRNDAAAAGGAGGGGNDQRSYILHGRLGNDGVWCETTNQGVIIIVYDDCCNIVIPSSLSSILPVSSSYALRGSVGVLQHSIDAGYATYLLADHIRTSGA